MSSPSIGPSVESYIMSVIMDLDDLQRYAATVPGMTVNLGRNPDLASAKNSDIF